MTRCDVAYRKGEAAIRLDGIADALARPLSAVSRSPVASITSTVAMRPSA